ncbi:MAG: dihydrodipicolinate synthase family protein [Fuerstiella sp.]|nr:dihydrodipicolinate synthase family protein [Fuerstiella sp.]
MQTDPVLPSQFRQSVLAVPPLARDNDLAICQKQNARMIQYLEAGGVSMLLYGGNANLYHTCLSEYAELLEMLQTTAASDTLVIPSVGPAWGTMMDQAAILKNTKFPTVMVLPQNNVATEAGFQSGFRRFVECIGRPAVLYIKEEGLLTPQGATELVDDGLVSFIKYAIVRDDTANDQYLEDLVERIDPQRICSGIGEQPALVHLTKFGCVGYTSGCVCVNPSLSQAMLKAITSGEYDRAEEIRRQFCPLEDLRNEINPIRVLHEAVELAEIADIGPHLPFLSGVASSRRKDLQNAAVQLKNCQSA